MAVDKTCLGCVFDEIAQEEASLGQRPVDDPRGVRREVQRPALRARVGAHQWMNGAFEPILLLL